MNFLYCETCERVTHHSDPPAPWDLFEYVELLLTCDECGSERERAVDRRTHMAQIEGGEQA